MKKVKVFLAAALLSMTSAAMAQATYTDAQGDTYTFKKHWTLGIQGGVQHTLGEHKFRHLISPNAQVSLGYHFNPVFSMRLQVNGWQSRGGWDPSNDVPQGVANAKFDYRLFYVAPGLDFMFNLSNLFCGWNPNRVVNVNAFVGGGVNIGIDNDEACDFAKAFGPTRCNAYNLVYAWDDTPVRLMGRAGLAVDFRLSDVVSLGIEGNANIVNKCYDSQNNHGDNPDWYFNLLAGVKFNLGKSYTKVVPVPEPVVEEPAPAPAPAPAPVVEEKPAPVAPAKVEALRRDVFFKINKSVVTDEQMGKLQEIAEYLEKYPEAKVVVTGYADAGTGTKAVNERVSSRRAAGVVKVLVEKFNVSRDRIVSEYKGSSVQPFADNDSNRVTICIAE
ncbi:MAG: OmpA family protein [Prevotella sp.]|nr:OmpA family protein [Prevotella sp.]MBO5156514.1 OmpA family protein [Prevotella sp.]